MPLGTLTRLVSPRTMLAATMLLSFIIWGALAHAASVPHFFFDELEYMKTGVSFAEGNGLQWRGVSWGFGPLYPLLVSGIVRLTPNQDATYEIVKAANAFFFATAAVPVYLLARRLLSSWPSVGIAALSVAIPSATYVSVVMTESLSYLLALWAIYAMALALERPTSGRQLAVVGTTVAMVADRPQLVVVYIAYLAALAAVVVVPSPQRASIRSSPTALWPTALSLVAGLAWLARPVLQGVPAGHSLGSYSALARSYQPLQVAKWFLYHVGDLALYMAVVPIVVAPVVVALCWSRARAGSSRHAAFLALFVVQNVFGIGLVAAFASTPFGGGLIFDRYLFYLVPLWLLALAVWLHEGMPKPVVPLALGGALAVATVSTLPFAVVSSGSSFSQFEAVATEVWGKVGRFAARVPLISARDLAVVFAVVLATAVAVVPRRYSWLLFAAIGTVMAANLALSWRSAFVDPAVFGASPPGTRSWVDARVGNRASVTVLSVARNCNLAVEGKSLLLTEFFNRSVFRQVTVAGEQSQLPTALDVRRDGTLEFRSGRPLLARYVVAQPGVELSGRVLARGMATHLVLWDAGGGPVQLATARSERELLRSSCST